MRNQITVSRSQVLVDSPNMQSFTQPILVTRDLRAATLYCLKNNSNQSAETNLNAMCRRKKTFVAGVYKSDWASDRKPICNNVRAFVSGVTLIGSQKFLHWLLSSGFENSWFEYVNH